MATVPPTTSSAADVRSMFDRIAPRYDTLNRLLSLRRDVAWRRALAARLPPGEGLRVLDLATGTADQAIALITGGDSRVADVVGIDVANLMLEIGRAKAARLGLSGRLHLECGDACAIPAPDGSFDAVTMSFGIRNVPDVPLALREMRRVLRPGGRALILEFSMPRKAVMKALYLFYLRHVLPGIGSLLSGDAAAYRYLNRTIESFPKGDAFCTLMRAAGFSAVVDIPLTLGIVSIYQGTTPSAPREDNHAR